MHMLWGDPSCELNLKYFSKFLFFFEWQDLYSAVGKEKKPNLAKQTQYSSIVKNGLFTSIFDFMSSFLWGDPSHDLI